MEEEEGDRQSGHRAGPRARRCGPGLSQQERSWAWLQEVEAADKVWIGRAGPDLAGT